MKPHIVLSFVLLIAAGAGICNAVEEGSTLSLEQWVEKFKATGEESMENCERAKNSLLERLDRGGRVSEEALQTVLMKYWLAESRTKGNLAGSRALLLQIMPQVDDNRSMKLWLHQRRGWMFVADNLYTEAVAEFQAAKDLSDALLLEVAVKRQENLIELGHALVAARNLTEADKVFWNALGLPYYCMPAREEDSKLYYRLVETHRNAILGLLVTRERDEAGLRELWRFLNLGMKREFGPRVEEAIQKAAARK
jgi:hypothetical protein